jgi:putative RecB family exonuclease
VPIYSHSRLSTFETCPLQYRYRYVERIPRDTQSIEAFMGNRVHEVLERLYRDLLRSRRPGLEELKTAYRRAWEENWSDKVTIVKTDLTPDHYRAVGERCLENYVRRNEPLEAGGTIGLEEKVELTLDASGRYRLMGYIDRLARPGPGTYEVHDYKTGSRPRDGDLRRDRQLTMYQMAVKQQHADARTVRLVWHYLQGRSPGSGATYEPIVMVRTEREVEEHRTAAMRVIDRIESATTYEAKVGPLCRWCEYNDICGPYRASRAADAPPKPSRPLDRAIQIGLFD